MDSYEVVVFNSDEDDTRYECISADSEQEAFKLAVELFEDMYNEVLWISRIEAIK